MEHQLSQLNRTHPTLFPIIWNAAMNAYHRVWISLDAQPSNPFARPRAGYLRHTVIDGAIHQAVIEAEFPDIQSVCKRNATGTAVHLEIHTPYALIMFAAVPSPGTVPHRAQYRQRYVDQCFMQEAYPDMLAFSSDCKPLYIITHSPNYDRSVSVPARMCIGRLSVDQSSWSCRYPFDESIFHTVCAEVIPEKEALVLPEEIRKTSRLSIKMA